MDRRGEKPNRPENFLKSNLPAFLIARILHEASAPLRCDQVISIVRQRMIDETTDGSLLSDEITDIELQRTLRSLGRRRIAMYRRPH